MTQELIVYIIGIAVALYIGYGVYRITRRKPDPCSGCTGCIVRSEYQRKKKHCLTHGLRADQGI